MNKIFRKRFLSIITCMSMSVAAITQQGVYVSAEEVDTTVSAEDAVNEVPDGNDINIDDTDYVDENSEISEFEEIDEASPEIEVVEDEANVSAEIENEYFVEVEVSAETENEYFVEVEVSAEAENEYSVEAEEEDSAVGAAPIELVNPDLDYCLTFTAESGFSLSRPEAFDGTLEYSTDGYNWKNWSSNISIDSSSEYPYVIYLRGKNNTYVWATNGETGSMIPSEPAKCEGDIMTLLDYEKVMNGEIITMADNCFSHLFYGADTLLTAPELTASELTNGCYEYMFYGCTNLKTAPELPARNIEAWCYSHMFEGCEKLEECPELPANTMFTGCYSSMFANCRSLKKACNLEATTLAKQCYYSMFYNCTSLEKCPDLPATSLPEGCYTSMFEGCTMLLYVPSFSVNEIASKCFERMFANCTGIRLFDTYDPEMDIWTIKIASTTSPASTYAKDMFAGCNMSITTPEINKDYCQDSATAEKHTVNNSNSRICFKGDSAFVINQPLFDGKLQYSVDGVVWFTLSSNKSGTTVPTIASSQEAPYVLYLRGSNNKYVNGKTDTFAYNASFQPSAPVECSGNIMALLDYSKASNNEEITMANECFAGLFADSKNLLSAPELPAQSLTAEHCYSYMFSGCTLLAEAPELPATTLSVSCYEHMFEGCTRLITTPELPALTLTKACYYYMFKDCTSLTYSCELKATVLAKSCYRYMFYNCSNLLEAPDLPAKVAESMCYANMFNNCASLTMIPNISVEQIASSCYWSMFSGCTNLAMSDKADTEYNTPWVLKASNTADKYANNMFLNCPHVCSEEPELNKTYYVKRNVLPDSSNNATDYCVTVQGYCSFRLSAPDSFDGKLEYSLNGGYWIEWDIENNPEIYVPDEIIYLRGTGNTYVRGSEYHSLKTNEATEFSGNIMNLLDYKKVRDGVEIVMSDKCFEKLFYNSKNMKTAPELPSQTLTDMCYYRMFYGCKSLETAPELPATNLAISCYERMFYGCQNLEEMPVLPATTLANNCYTEMFSNCYNLVRIHELPATIMADNCYKSMFSGCSSLVIAPKLPAMQLADSCYYYMFYNCSSLKEIPTLPAEELKPNCYYGMFFSCVSLELCDEADDDHMKEWKMPNFSGLSSAYCENMFSNCGSKVCVGTPNKNTTYYTKQDTVTMVGMSATLEGEIGINFYLSLPGSVVFDNQSYIQVNTQKYYMNECESTNYGYKITYYIAPKEISDDISISVYSGNENEKKIDFFNGKNGSYTFSFVSYLNKLSQSSDPSTAELAKSMIDYGDAAKYYFQYNTGNNDLLPNIKNYDLSGYTSNMSDYSVEGFEYIGSSLVLNNEVAIRHYFKAADMYTFNFEVDGENAKIYRNGSMMYIEIGHIPGQMLGRNYTLTVTGADETFFINYSVLSYMYLAKEDGSTDTCLLANAMCAFYNACVYYEQIHSIGA